MADFDRTADHMQLTGTQTAATEILGPCIMAWTAEIILCGISLSVFANYVGGRLYKADSIGLKALVWGVMLSNLASTGIAWNECFVWMTSQSRDFDSLNGYIPADCMVYLFEGIVGSLVQSYLVERATRLVEQPALRNAIKVLLYSAIITSFAMSITSTVLLFQLQAGVTPGTLTVNLTIPIWLWVSAGTDMLITILLYIKLRKQVLGFSESTDYVIVKLIRLALLTALPTTLMATAGAITSYVVTQRNSPMYALAIVFISPLAPLYTLALLFTLNSRASLRAGLYSVNAGLTSNSKSLPSTRIGSSKDTKSTPISSPKITQYPPAGTATTFESDPVWKNGDLPVTVTVEMDRLSENADHEKQSFSGYGGKDVY